MRLMGEARRTPDGLRVILMYHSVGHRTPRSLPPDVFERHLRALKQAFELVPVRQLRSASAAPQGNVACVSFDDGYRDNYEQAAPILTRLGVPATFFVATGFLGGTLHTRYAAFPMMSPAQVRELADTGFEIGAHTVSHTPLTRLSSAEARDEITTSKRFLEDLLGAEIQSFAYPRGDHDVRVRTLVEEEGFRAAVTTREHLVRAGADWLALPRVGTGRHLEHRLRALDRVRRPPQEPRLA